MDFLYSADVTVIFADWKSYFLLVSTDINWAKNASSLPRPPSQAELGAPDVSRDFQLRTGKKNKKYKLQIAGARICYVYTCL